MLASKVQAGLPSVCLVIGKEVVVKLDSPSKKKKMFSKISYHLLCTLYWIEVFSYPVE